MRPMRLPLSLHLLATALLGAQALSLAFALAGSTPLWGRVLAVGFSAGLSVVLFRSLTGAAPAEDTAPVE